MIDVRERASAVRTRNSAPMEIAMGWETPTFVEINMDAELSSYVNDLGDEPVGAEPLEDA
jgi:hypothetical protein